MKLFFFLTFINFSYSVELAPFGGVIKNNKTGEKIISYCHQGQHICSDLRLHLVDKNFHEIRQLNKIKTQIHFPDPTLSGDNEYINTPQDFKDNLISKMLETEFVVTEVQNLIPRRIKKTSNKFYNALVKVTELDNKMEIIFKDFDFILALDVLDN